MTIDADLLTPDSLQMPPDRVNNFWYARRDPGQVIVFLHGIFSASRTCWLYEDPPSGRRVFWPDLIRRDNRFGNASIYLAGYYTAIDAGDFSIAQCAREVLEALKTPEADGFPPVLQASHLVLVCHSTGGIIARYMIDRYVDTFRDKALGLALIASPSLGSVWANIAGLAAKYYNQRLGQQLQWEGEALEDIHGRFKDLVNEKGTRLPGLFGMEACENKMIMRDRIPSLVRMFLPPRLKVVTTISAGQYFGDVKVLRDTDHFSSVKPSGPHHPSHEFLVTFEREFQRAVGATSEGTNQSQSAPDVAHSTPEAQPVDDLEATEWPKSMSSTNLFLSATGFEADSEIAVISCVVLDAVEALNNSLNDTLQSWGRDPYVRDLPGVSDITRRRDLSYTSLDPDVREKLVEWMSGQLFEAYVCYGHAPLDSKRLAMLNSLLNDRLLANRTKAIVVKPDRTLAYQRADIIRLTGVAKDDVRTASKGVADLVASVEEVSRNDAGAIAAMLVGQVVRDRLRAPSGREGRAFARIHPQKIRVMHDFDAHVRYTRRNPFQG